MGCLSSVKCGSNQYCDPSSHRCHSCNVICNPNHVNRDLCSNLCQEFWPPSVNDTNQTPTEIKHDRPMPYYVIVLCASFVGIFVVIVIIKWKSGNLLKCRNCIKTYPRRNTEKWSDVEQTRETSIGEGRQLVERREILTGIDGDEVDAGMKKIICDPMDVNPFWTDVSFSGNIISQPTDDAFNHFGIEQQGNSANQNAPETDCRDAKTRKSINQQSAGEETVPKSSLHDVLAEDRFSAGVEDNFPPESLAFGDLVHISPSLHPSSVADTSLNCDLKSDPVTVHGNRFDQVLKAYDAVNMRAHKFSYIRGCMVDSDKFYVIVSNSCGMNRAQNEIRNILPPELQSDVVAIQYNQNAIQAINKHDYSHQRG